MHALGPIEVLFLLAPFAVVPLALRLLAGLERPTWALAWARRVQPWAALAVMLSFAWGRRGAPAALLALPWLGVTALVALHGAIRLWRTARATAGRGGAALAEAAACLFLPVGGGWLVLSRLGVSLGFDEPLPLLTAVHFHYAAFAALVIVGQVGRAAGEGRAYRAIAAAAVAGPPLLAAGITASPRLEIAAASLLVLALGALAVLTLVRVVPSVHGTGRLLLVLSSLSVLAGMACALAYAIGEFTGIGIISLGRMARIHGPLNGLGFALCGLAGWLAASRNLRPRSL